MHELHDSSSSLEVLTCSFNLSRTLPYSRKHARDEALRGDTGRGRLRLSGRSAVTGAAASTRRGWDRATPDVSWAQRSCLEGEGPMSVPSRA